MLCYMSPTPAPNVENDAPLKNTWKRLETAYNDF